MSNNLDTTEPIEVDTEYTWMQEPQTMTHSDEVAQLRARIAELEADYNEMSLQNEHIVKENGVSVARIAELERERDAATQRATQLDNEFYNFRHDATARFDLDIFDEPCSKCGGYRVISYPNTTGWRGGFGGQAITEDICSECWGSGQKYRKFRNLKEGYEYIEMLSQQVRDVSATAEYYRAVLQDARDERDAAIQAANAQSEYIQSNGLTEFEMARLKAERDAALAKLSEYEGENKRWHSFETVQAIVKERDAAIADARDLARITHKAAGLRSKDEKSLIEKYAK